MTQHKTSEEGVPREDGQLEDHSDEQVQERSAEDPGTKYSQMRKSLWTKPDLPPPMTIHTSMTFLDKFEDLDSAITAVDEIEPATPTSLGVPPPPKPPLADPAPAPPGPPTPKWSRSHEIAFIIIVCLAQFITLGALAQTVAPLSLIVEDLKVSNPGQLSWFTAAYSMTLGTFILPAGMY
jgi:hypothetical protein